MSITTVDGMLAGMLPELSVLKVGATTVVGRHYSTFYVAGGAAVAPSPGVAGAALTSYAGQIPWVNPVSGNSYIGNFVANCSVVGTLLLCDRLWHNSGLSATLTTSQTVNSVTFPARDRTGTTDGHGVIVGFEVSSSMGTGTPTFTLGYTNSAGASGRSITTASQSASMAAGSFIPIQLAAGDTGVRSIQSWQLSSSMTSGAYHLVAYRVLARLGLPVPNVAVRLNALDAGFRRLYDNTVPFLLWLPATTTAPTINADMTITQG